MVYPTYNVKDVQPRQGVLGTRVAPAHRDNPFLARFEVALKPTSIVACEGRCVVPSLPPIPPTHYRQLVIAHRRCGKDVSAYKLQNHPNSNSMVLLSSSSSSPDKRNYRVRVRVRANQSSSPSSSSRPCVKPSKKEWGSVKPSKRDIYRVKASNRQTVEEAVGERQTVKPS